MPESWEWTTIGEIASSILYGVSESAKETGQYKLLRITDIQNNKVNWETVPFTDYDNNKAQAYLLNDGDILFARTGATVGKSYLVEGLRDSAIYASYLIRVQTSSVILPAYIKFFFESGFYWEQISLNSVGIGQPNVNGTTLANRSKDSYLARLLSFNKDILKEVDFILVQLSTNDLYLKDNDFDSSDEKSTFGAINYLVNYVKKNFKAKSNDPFIFPWNKLVNIVIGPKVVNVYSVSGALANTFIAKGEVCYEPIELSKGVYVVSVEACKQTIVIR